MKARQWFQFKGAANDPTVAEIHIIDIIGDWVDELINEYYGMTATVTAKAFVDQLAKLPDAVSTIKVHINSPGGDVFAALNISNALREQQTSKGRSVETIVDGLAASAASIIMMAGKKVTIADNAMVMVHNPWSGAVGNSAALRKTADTLDAIRNTIVATYKWHSSLESDALVALMDAETWMDAQQALEYGFATDKVDGLKAAASIDRAAVSLLTVPDKFKARVDALLKPVEPKPAAAAAVDVLAKVSAAGLDIAFAEALLASALPMDQVVAKIDEAKTAKAAEQTRAAAVRATEKTRVDDIRALCATAKHDALADRFIADGTTVEGARALLTYVKASVDRAVSIDGSLQPGEQSPRAAINHREIYDARNKR